MHNSYVAHGILPKSLKYFIWLEIRQNVATSLQTSLSELQIIALDPTSSSSLDSEIGVRGSPFP